MDKVLSEEVVVKRQRKLYYTVIFIIFLLAALVWLLRYFIKPSLSKSEITTAVVEIGDVENTLNASGEILPEFEQVISSPIKSSIQNVLVDAGASIKVNQPILTLDKSTTQSEYEKQKFQLESKRNSIEKLKLELEKSFFDLKSNNDIKQLKINSLKASLDDTRRLYKAGGATREDVAQAELNLRVAELEKKQLENEIKNKQKTMQADMRESELAAAIQENDLQELHKKLLQADILATRSGVLTWVNKNIGSSINEGDVLAKIADLRSFKVSGNLADTYLDQIHLNMPALVRINETQLSATVSNISPSIQNGIINFTLQLDDRSNKLLRPNMKVDVFLVTEKKSKVMRVSNGPAFKGGELQDVFVIHGGKAERRTVHTGLSNSDYIEIKDQVKPGEVIITSDVSDYKNADEITVK